MVVGFLSRGEGVEGSLFSNFGGYRGVWKDVGCKGSRVGFGTF